MDLTRDVSVFYMVENTDNVFAERTSTACDNPTPPPLVASPSARPSRETTICFLTNNDTCVCSEKKNGPQSIRLGYDASRIPVELWARPNGLIPFSDFYLSAAHNANRRKRFIVFFFFTFISYVPFSICIYFMHMCIRVLGNVNKSKKENYQNDSNIAYRKRTTNDCWQSVFTINRLIPNTPAC